MRSTCRIGRVCSAVLLVCSAGLPQRGQADNWPAWRGKHNDGLTAETDCPLSWSATENVLWKVPVPGVGHSSPIVWEHRIFVTTCLTDDLSRRLICFDRETGRQLWNQIVATAPIEKMHRDNTPASATPATDGQFVFVTFCVSGHVQVSAYGLDGDHVWTVTPGSFESQHGFSTALIIDDNRLYVSGLQDGDDAFVAALDTRSGKTLWRVPRPRKVRSFSAPHLCHVSGRPAFILSGSEQTIAYDRMTGETLWEVEGPAEKTVSSVVSCDASQMAFVCGGRDKQLLAISLSDALPERAGGQVTWKASRAIPYMTSPLVCQGYLHILSDDGVYSCYETDSGRLLKQMRPLGPVRASMVATSKRIYATELSGTTTVIANDPNWTVLSVNDLGEEVYASPAISDGDFIFRTVQHLVLIREAAAE